MKYLHTEIRILLTAACVSAAGASNAIDFQRDVRPILAEHCFKCHGPDSKNREAGLRLDTKDSAFRILKSSKRAVVPGKPLESELLRRIATKDLDERMPPVDESDIPLAADQIAVLRRWIEQGAPWQAHWSIVPPARSKPPAVKNTKWVRTPIDRFVLARLEAEELGPSTEANRHTLIRRLCLDLTGLPPTIAEVDAFVSDARPDAYERLVDRLLESEHYGEKMAQWWLDLARFGDTNGYQDDGYRPIWVYRDYVIDSFNRNKPFDQFTIESLAGDMLPAAIPEQKVLSGFNRMHRYNEEGGSDPEEFRVVYAIDRTNTTATVWLGLTLGCAQCHDHKYDPLTQRDYYSFFAFFNSLEGEKPVSKDLPPPPFIRVPSLEQRKRLAEIEVEIAKDSPSVEALRRERNALSSSFPQAVVMAEMIPRQPAHILKRGDWQQPGEQVEPNVPAVFPPLPDDAPRDRLALARWLVRREHPLTARVIANHLWKQLFGEGLVRTMSDFGSQGEPPTHPELFDWLAVEFIESGWDVKALQKQMVMSATYRQASIVIPELRSSDPQNRLLARATRFRLSAEEIRDGALAASGLLTRKIGGPSVYPYQPSDYYGDKSRDWKWIDSHGADLYRRGLYTFWRRTTMYPSFQVFDAPDRGQCTLNRPRTNTPLQALVTLNDPVFVEAARVLGQRIMKQGGETDDDRIRFAFRAVLSRPPSNDEMNVMRKSYKHRLGRYESDLSAAVALSSHGQASQPPNINAAELAAWTSLASVLLNLDETITRK